MIELFNMLSGITDPIIWVIIGLAGGIFYGFYKFWYMKGGSTPEADASIVAFETKVVDEIKDHSTKKTVETKADAPVLQPEFENKVKEATSEIVKKDVNVIETINEVPTITEMQSSDGTITTTTTVVKRGRPAKQITETTI